MILAGHLLAAQRFADGEPNVGRKLDLGAALRAMKGGTRGGKQ